MQWCHGDPHCGAPGGRYLKVYMFHLVNPVALSAGPPPEVEQRGPYVYRVGWNYSQFNWSQSWSSSADNVSFVAEEQLTFCPGFCLPPSCSGNPGVNGRILQGVIGKLDSCPCKVLAGYARHV